MSCQQKKTPLQGFRHNTNLSVQLQQKARSLKSCNLGYIKKKYCTTGIGKTKALHSYCTSDLRLCFAQVKPGFLLNYEP